MKTPPYNRLLDRIHEFSPGSYMVWQPVTPFLVGHAAFWMWMTDCYDVSAGLSLADNVWHAFDLKRNHRADRIGGVACELNREPFFPLCDLKCTRGIRQ